MRDGRALRRSWSGGAAAAGGRQARGQDQALTRRPPAAGQAAQALAGPCPAVVLALITVAGPACAPGAAGHGAARLVTSDHPPAEVDALAAEAAEASWLGAELVGAADAMAGRQPDVESGAVAVAAYARAGLGVPEGGDKAWPAWGRRRRSEAGGEAGTEAAR